MEAFLTLLWDIGLNIAHSVRTVAQCVQQAGDDITVLTNLMEARVIRGDATLMQQVRELTGSEHMWPSADFFKAKLDEQKARHAKFADTEYNLEPNVKSSPGGLRDLQIIGWIAERHFGVESLEKITSEEFLNQLAGHNHLPGILKVNMPSFLEQCDLVKFARQALAHTQRIELLDTASTVVRETDASLVPVEPDPEKEAGK
jgi:hypothetical protein